MAVALKNGIIWPKNGPKTCPVASRGSFQHKKGPICLILTTFWDEITFGYITRGLGADFEETHFFIEFLLPTPCLFY